MIRKYLTEKKRLINTIFISYTSISTILYLYSLDFEIIIYPVLIGLVINLCYLFFDYKNFLKTIENIKYYKENTFYINNKKSEYNNIVEKEYFEIFKILKEENKKIIVKNKKEQENIQDYYTQWVHQIKTPIAALGFLIENEEHKEKIKLEKELFKIEQYVDMVLTYLRLDSEHTDLKAEKVYLEKVVKDIIKKYSTFFIAKKIKLTINITENYILITDSKWLSVALEQIINNSIKYVKREGIINIYLEKNTLIIEDNGIGIASEDIPLLFEKGYTGFNGRKNKKSSGIGLYLTKKTLDKLGYKIKIKSEVNEGTVVKIYLKDDNLIIK